MGVGLVLTCPMSACDHVEIPDAGWLAAHLVEHHLLAAGEALRRARAVAEAVPAAPLPAAPRGSSAIRPRHQQEETMASKKDYVCRRCGTKGHSARSAECPKRDAPAGTARAPLTRRGPTPKAVTPSANGFAGALAALRAEYAELGAAIAALGRLEARR